MSQHVLSDNAAQRVLDELRLIRLGVERIGRTLDHGDTVQMLQLADSAPAVSRPALTVASVRPCEAAEPEVAATAAMTPVEVTLSSDHDPARPMPGADGPAPGPAAPVPDVLAAPLPRHFENAVAAPGHEPWLTRLSTRRPSGLRWFTPDRVLGVVGSLVTLVGVVFALVLGVHYGWFGPGARLASLGALAAGLGAAAVKVHPRTVNGAVALAATSVSAVFLVIVAATSIYGWMPLALGLVAASSVAFGAFAWAMRWNSQLLGALTLLEMAVAVPAVTGFDSTLAINLSCLFVLAAAAALTVIATRAGWGLSCRIALGTGLFFSIFPLVGAHLDTGLDASFATALAMGLVLAVLTVFAKDVVCLGLALLVLLVDLTSMHHPAESVLPGALCLAGALGARALPDRRGQVLVVFAAVAGFQATALGAGTGLRGTAFAAGAVALALAGRRASSGLFTVLSWFWTFAALACVVVPGIEVTVSSVGAWRSASSTLALSALLLTVAAVVDMGSTTPIRSIRRVDRVMVGLVVALLSSGVVLVSACALGLGVFEGFRLGHVLTTVVWVVTGVALLLRRSQLRAMGFVLSAVAVAKLFLFDLVALDGWMRSVLFLVGGLLLLGAATQYRARDMELAAAQPTPHPESSAHASTPAPS